MISKPKQIQNRKIDARKGKTSNLRNTALHYYRYIVAQ